MDKATHTQALFLLGQAESFLQPDVIRVAITRHRGTLAIFYKDFGYSNGLIKPGKICAISISK